MQLGGENDNADSKALGDVNSQHATASISPITSETMSPTTALVREQERLGLEY
jgi:hypothetical protein